MKKSIQQNPDVQSPNNLPYVPLKKKSKLMYHHQHNSILKQPSVIEQIPGKGPSLYYVSNYFNYWLIIEKAIFQTF